MAPARASLGAGEAAPDVAVAGGSALSGGVSRGASCCIGSTRADGLFVAEAAGLSAALAIGAGGAGGAAGISIELGAGAFPLAPSLEATAGGDAGAGGAAGTGAGTPQGVVGDARTLAAS